jgi:undecaprenyl-phosphate 4-deoxy-4-formamido-L-arabinose transferase
MKSNSNKFNELSIVIPVYRSEKNLVKLVEQIEQFIYKKIKKIEVIFVNDCSPDGSWKVIQSICNEVKWVKGINLRKNTGQHNAIMAGLNFAKGKVVVMMDDDLQHSPKDVIKLYNKIIEGNDVCYTKYKNRKHPLWKKLGSSFNDRVANFLLEKPRGLYLSSFKAISYEMKDEIIKYTGPFSYIDGLILMNTSNIVTIEVEHHERNEGIGNYTLLTSLKLWMGMATNFSIIPLRLASMIGFFTSFLGLFFGICLVFLKLFIDYPLPWGWSSLVLFILLIGGIQLIALGALGEYLGRTYININKKPQYTIREKKNL